MQSTIECAKDAEPIPGYTLQERIGVDGYGEVWKASAPGGLTKAIKFVYGHLDDARASRELKSLDRIKQVHHPFLLSLERIEIIDGHLIIVTELADMSLRDRFEQCRKMGQPGIPRKELLVYLRDAADALDYLYTSQALQHLDVKPENLLLLGNRIKVADFGLLKDLHDTTSSLTNGLTPTYSPPEVFDGQPNQYSDQYSLAIVCQEMLTGELPFDGRTASQLASQHVHSEPNLSPLSRADQFGVGRALCKDAEKRFGSCGEFVEFLFNPPSAVTGIVKEPVPSRTYSQPSHDAGSEYQTETQRHDGQTIVVSQPEIISLPPLDVPEAIYRPTVFVGIGGTAGRILRNLRRRLTHRFGNVDAVPSLQMLLIDTDIDSINYATSGDEHSALRERETLLLPLRPAKVYREHLGGLDSISHRWIYNIPRSLRTEGLRALGRIALMDHSRSTVERVQASIATAADRKSITESSENTGLEFRHGAPRIFVIASVSGGTGGGMVLDVGYLVRQVLADLCLADDDVYGILTHSTQQQVKTRSLAPANAYACLSELRHFSQPGNDYPGEPTRGLAGFRENAGSFSSTYFVHLGEELSESEFDKSADRLAEYLYLNSASTSCSFFDKCRKGGIRDDAAGGQELKLRTLGLFQLSETNVGTTSVFADVLCKTLVHQWRGGVNASREQRLIKLSELNDVVQTQDGQSPFAKDMEQRAAAYMTDLRINVDSLAERIRELAQFELGSDPDAYFHQVISDSQAKAHSRGEFSLAATICTVDAIIGAKGDSTADANSHIESLRDVLGPQLRDLAKNHGSAIHGWIMELVNTSSVRVDGAHHTAKWLADFVKSQEDKAAVLIRPVQAKLLQLREALMEADLSGDPKSMARGKRSAELEAHLLNYAQSKLDEVVLAGVCKVLSIIESHIAASFDRLCDLWTNLNQIAEEFPVPPGWDEAGLHGDAVTCTDRTLRPLRDVLLDHKSALVRRLDQEMEARFFCVERQNGRGFAESINIRKNLVKRLCAEARKIVTRLIRTINCKNLNDLLVQKPNEGSTLLRKCLKVATPRLLECGGAKRLLVSVSKELDSSRLRDEIRRVSNDEPTVVSVEGGDMILCYEAEQISLESVASKLIDNRPDYAQMASRLHTRVDINWSSI